MDKVGDSKEAKSWKTTTGEVLWTRRGRTQVDTKKDISGKGRIWYFFLLRKPKYAMLNSIWICHWLHIGRLQAIFITIFIRNAPKVCRAHLAFPDKFFSIAACWKELLGTRTVVHFPSTEIKISFAGDLCFPVNNELTSFCFVYSRMGGFSSSIPFSKSNETIRHC